MSVDEKYVRSLLTTLAEQERELEHHRSDANAKFRESEAYRLKGAVFDLEAELARLRDELAAMAKSRDYFEYQYRSAARLAWECKAEANTALEERDALKRDLLQVGLAFHHERERRIAAEAAYEMAGGDGIGKNLAAPDICPCKDANCSKAHVRNARRSPETGHER